MNPCYVQAARLKSGLQVCNGSGRAWLVMKEVWPQGVCKANSFCNCIVCLRAFHSNIQQPIVELDQPTKQSQRLKRPRAILTVTAQPPQDWNFRWFLWHCRYLNLLAFKAPNLGCYDVPSFLSCCEQAPSKCLTFTWDPERHGQGELGGMNRVRGNHTENIRTPCALTDM